MKLGSFECQIEFSGCVEDTYVLSGYGLNTGRNLSDKECDRLVEEYAEDIYMAWLEEQIGRAEAAYEGDR